MSGPSTDLTALSWCLGEIRESLARAESTLEQHLQSEGEDTARLRAARGWLHQAHGALQVVALEGVATITQEVEGLLDRCDRGEIAFTGEVLRPLARAFAAIVEYLEGLVAGSGDSPVSLFPYYRDLLALRAAERVEPADLFPVDLSIRPPRAVAAEPLDPATLASVRTDFERGLLGFLRNPRDADALGAMHSAVDRLHRAHQTSNQRTFWWLATAFFDALRVQALPVDIYAKRLVARINLQIRRTLQQGAPIADRMLRDILFLIARTGSGSALADEARRLYGLAGTVPSDFETPRYGIVDARTLRTAREATAAAKAGWEKYVRGSAQDLPAFAQAAQQLDTAVSRLPWPGMQKLSAALVGLRRALAAAGSSLAEVLSLEVATALLFVEQAIERGARGIAQHDRRAAEMATRLDRLCEHQESDGTPMPEWLTDLSQAAQERLTTAAFAGELRTNLRNCETVLDAFFRDTDRRAELETLAPMLRQVGGALRLLGHDEAAEGADTVIAQVAAFVASDEPPAAADCERVAEGLGALGFFVESLRQAERQGGGFEFSRDGGGFVARLGEPPVVAASEAEPDASPAVPIEVAPFDVTGPLKAASAAASPDASTDAAQDDSGAEPVDIVETDAGDSLEQLLAQRRAQVRPLLSTLAASPADGGARAALRDTLVSVRDEAMLLDDGELRARASIAIERLDAGDAPTDAALVDAVQRVAGIAVDTPAALTDLPADDAIDDELLGIFLDEADEVLAAIDENRVASAAAPPDAGFLTTIRRGFHTLKGSSRMVGLSSFGDAAWTFEQLLNGWLADERPGTPALYALIDEARRTMSDWVLRLRADATAAIAPAALIARAVALRDGTPMPVEVVAPPPAAIEPVEVAFDDAPLALDEPFLMLDADPSDADATSRVDAPDALDPGFPELPRGEPFAELATDASRLDDAALEAAALEAIELDVPTRPMETVDLDAPTRPLESIDLDGLDGLDSLDGEPPVLDVVAIDATYDAVDAAEVVDATQVVDADEVIDFATIDSLDEVLDVDALDVVDEAPEVQTIDVDALDVDAHAGAALREALAGSTDGADELIELSEILDPIDLEVPVLSALDEIEPLPLVLAGDALSDSIGADDMVRIGDRELSAQLFRIFVAEAGQLLEVLDAGHARWVADPAAAVDEAALRAVHSLGGSTRIVGLPTVHDASDALERFMLGHAVGERALEAVDLDDHGAVLAGIRRALDRFAALEEPGPDAELAARADALARRWSDPGAMTVGGHDAAAIALREAEQEAMLDAARLEAGQEALLDAAAPEALDATPAPAPTPAHDRAVEPTADFALAAADAPHADAPRVDDAAPADDLPPPDTHAPPPTLAQAVRAAAAAAAPVNALEGIASLVDEIDAELAPVFIEEADELLPRIGDALRAWALQPGDASHPESLMRLLHTVKGSARMAGAMRLGQLVHDMETRIESASALPHVPGALIDDLIARNDQVLALYEAVRDPRSESAQAASRAVIRSLTGVDAEQAAAAEGAPAAIGEPTAAPAAMVAAAGGPQQLIRVRADLLDRLVNEAGEVSIARARLENELGGIRQSLGELSENVNRLRSQLREIELAADSQIQARTARTKELEAEFDPLEFDRYTRFQELTRMLAESVSDVATVQHNALRNLDEASRDLARQSQVTRDLQQDLMRIRMVQFGSVADRLYRVVRQAAKELDKRVHLDLKGANAELDRGVLERMAGPIEHLLRNAVAHGIESRVDRVAAGKSETGEITLEVRQEGNEVTLSFADDGGGLDYGRIRARAIERGMLPADAHPGERELGELIFTPGFSTATEVTALSGRGVGMDVVRAEVAAMGGRIDIESTPGRGTRFTVHLPVSLAVAQVVLLTVGTFRTSVASALIEQVLQLKPEALAAAYAQHHVDWHGQPVPLYFLGSLLELPGNTPLAQRYSPVVILRSGSQRIALHVDHVAPSQEVVVKHVGPQLARLTGMAGATVLGNGEIVLILNPVQIAATGRGAQAGEGDTASFAPTRIEIAPTVMVVDDSVTVRKVTQRLLVREGYQVMLAKDGIDAMRQLQDTVPDVMLLDIEMPRMDGFELTRNIRGDERWRHLPIVMITSRTADKHRDHAMSLGVDVFLGKPFDEAELLQHVGALAARRQVASQ